MQEWDGCDFASGFIPFQLTTCPALLILLLILEFWFGALISMLISTLISRLGCGFKVDLHADFLGDLKAGFGRSFARGFLECFAC